MNGYECVSQFRAWEQSDASGRPPTPQYIAGMSAYVTESESELALQAGMSTMLSKPINRENVLAIVRQQHQLPRSEDAPQSGGAAARHSGQQDVWGNGHRRTK